MSQTANNVLGFPAFRDRLWRQDMPKPLADLYAAAQRLQPEQQYGALLEFGEGVAHFVAVLAIANAAAQGVAASEHRKWIGRFLPDKFGSSVVILQKAIEAAPAHFCPELRQWIDAPGTLAVFQALANQRNDDAHHRGPVGREARIQEARQLVKVMDPWLAGLEWLARYGFGYFVDAKALRLGGWAGHWLGFRGENRTDDDGSVRGTAAAPPPTGEVVLVLTDGSAALPLSPLWAIVAIQLRDRLCALAEIHPETPAAPLRYRVPSERSLGTDVPFDRDPNQPVDAYYREPIKWHRATDCRLDGDSIALILGKSQPAAGAGRLRLLAELAAPTGPAWQAEDTVDASEKLAYLLREATAESASERKAFSDRLRKVTEPALPRFLGLEPVEGKLYVVFEAVRGQRVRDWLATRSRLSPIEAATYVRGLLKALTEAHTNGLVHRGVDPLAVVVTPQGQLRLIFAALAPEHASQDTTRHALVLPDRYGVPSLCTSEQHDVAGVASVLAKLCGVTVELGKRPPDLQFEAADTPLPLAQWFDRAVRRFSEMPPFVNARDALLALDHALGQAPGLTTAAQHIGGGVPTVTRQASATVPTAPAAASTAPPLGLTQLGRHPAAAPMPEPRGARANDPIAKPAETADAPPSATVAKSSPLRWLVLIVVVGLLGVTAVGWKSILAASGGGSAAASKPALVAVSAPAAPAKGPSSPTQAPATNDVWTKALAALPRAGLAEQWRAAARTASVHQLLSLTTEAIRAATVRVEDSDVRPGIEVRQWTAPSGDKTSFLLADVSSSGTLRIGTWFSPKDRSCAAFAAQLPPADETWSLDCGGEVQWHDVGGAWLHVYVPPGSGACEWWLHASKPAKDSQDGRIARAFSCNDAGVQAWKDGQPDKALALLRKAVVLTDNYGKAAARGCFVAAYLGVAAQDLCDLGARSNYDEATQCASNAKVKKIKLTDAICGK